MYQHILFDLDGTLTDPAAGILRSLRYALGKMGLADPGDDVLLHFIGPPLVESFQSVCSLTQEQAWEAILHYREYYGEHGLYDNRIYPGIEPLLQSLHQQGKSLYVATTKMTSFAVQVLEHFHLAGYFSQVVGALPDGSRTAKRELIAEILKEIPEQERAKAVMIGDRKYDMIGAKAHNLDCIAVTYGYGSIEELRSEDPTQMVSSLDELKNILVGNHPNFKKS